MVKLVRVPGSGSAFEVGWVRGHDNYNVGWDHHSRTSWEERQDSSHSPHIQRSSLEDTKDELARIRAEMEDSRPQMAKASLEKTMAELRRNQADLAMIQVEN